MVVELAPILVDGLLIAKRLFEIGKMIHGATTSILHRGASIDHRDALALDALMNQVLSIHVVPPLPVFRNLSGQIDHLFTPALPVFALVSQLRSINHTPCGLKVDIFGRHFLL
jgi:hypothetical protein